MSECNKCNGTLFVCENHPDQEAHECKHCCGAGMPCECTKISEPIGNTEQLAEPVAVRYDFDGYGYMYMDAGSGSDWASRVKNCEFLYTHPMVSKSADMLRKQAKEIEELKNKKIIGLEDGEMPVIFFPVRYQGRLERNPFSLSEPLSLSETRAICDSITEELRKKNERN